MRSSSLTLSARYLFPVEGPPLADASCTIEEGRIAWFGPSSERAADLDLGNVAIVPGFVNAHTHLELTPVREDAARRDAHADDEVSWLRRVVDQRRGRSEDALRKAVGRNLQEC